MNSRKPNFQSKKQELTYLKFNRFLRNVAVLVTLAKLYIIFNITPFLFSLDSSSSIKINGIWFGADAENYLQSAQAILRDGFFSSYEGLSYFPSGYPFLIYLLQKVFGSYGLIMLSILQTVVFSLSCVYLAKFMQKICNKQIYSYTVFLMLLFNPTLSLSSMVIGYESLVASTTLFLVGFVIKLIYVQSSGVIFELKLKNFSPIILLTIVIFVSNISQPRYSVVFIIISLMLWFNLDKSKLKIALVTTLILSSLSSLIFLANRNFQVSGHFELSHNLGNTMNIGAGNDATGGYDGSAKGVVCDTAGSDTFELDAKLRNCVVKWYISNPAKAVNLFWNKTLFFWSPWAGPIANGTMARNPWLKYHPINKIADDAKGLQLIYGNFGIWFSYLLISINILLFLFGSIKSLLDKMSISIAMRICSLTVLLSWLTSLLTIGDHRFRVPTLGLSIVVQLYGLFRFCKFKI